MTATTGNTSYSPTASGAQRNGLGTAALVLGILALVTCWTVVGGIVLGILAVVFGVIGRNRARRSEATNGGVAIAGLVIGAVGLVLAVVLLAAGLTFIDHHHKAINNLQACDKHATTQAQRDQCNQQFSNSVSGN